MRFFRSTNIPATIFSPGSHPQTRCTCITSLPTLLSRKLSETCTRMKASTISVRSVKLLMGKIKLNVFIDNKHNRMAQFIIKLQFWNPLLNDTFTHPTHLPIYFSAKNRDSFQNGRSPNCLPKIRRHYKMHLTLKSVKVEFFTPWAMVHFWWISAICW